MMNIKFIQNNKELVKKAIKDKNINLDLDHYLDLSEKRLKLLQEAEELRSKRNEIAQEINRTQKEKGPDFKEYISEGKEIKEKLKSVEDKYKKIEQEFDALSFLVPNIPSDDSPIGKDDSDNIEVARWGDIPKFDFEIKSHIELGKELNLIDTERGVKTSGFRGYYLKNEAAQMHLGLMVFAFNKLISKGFTPFIPPTLLREFALIGSGHFPEGKNEIYQISNPGRLSDGKDIKEPIFLGGTSEPALLAYYADSRLEENDLPIKMCGLSQCYRSEVGSYGKDTQGIYRIHEFLKVEQVVIMENDLKKSNKILEELRSISEEILRELGVPYCVQQICTGDMGSGKHKMYDIESWMPSRQSYGETHSDSNLTDWQSRRLNIKYKDKSGKLQHCFTLNNTAIASPRILISLLECNQTKEGHVKIPKVLQPYLNGKEIIKRS